MALHEIWIALWPVIFIPRCSDLEMHNALETRCRVCIYTVLVVSDEFGIGMAARPRPPCNRSKRSKGEVPILLSKLYRKGRSEASPAADRKHLSHAPGNVSPGLSGL